MGAALGRGVVAASSLVLGMLLGLARSWPSLAIFVSNLPEAVGSATDMRASGSSKRQIRLLWLVVAGLCALATPLGYLLGFAVAAGLSTATA